ncbi:hypothetical protein BRC2024_EJDNWAKA_CDS_0001 [Acinetobacter phage vB_AbaP_Fanak]
MPLSMWAFFFVFFFEVVLIERKEPYLKSYL